jgi:hypothetical protein
MRGCQQIVGGSVLILMFGCVGVQTGDDGSSENPDCTSPEHVVVAIKTIPAGFSSTVSEIFGPTTTRFDGTMKLADGTESTMTIELATDAASWRLLQYEDYLSDCVDDHLQASGLVTLRGEPLLGGTLRAQFSVSSAQNAVIAVSIAEDPECSAPTFATTIEPRLKYPPTSEPRLVGSGWIKDQVLYGSIGYASQFECQKPGAADSMNECFQFGDALAFRAIESAHLDPPDPFPVKICTEEATN